MIYINNSPLYHYVKSYLKLHNVPGENLTKYLELIDNKISVLENKIVTLTKELNFHINPPAEEPIITPEIE